jgi:hypothetical protein
MVVEGDNALGVIHHGRHKDFSGFNYVMIERACTDNMDSVDFFLGIQRDNAELFNWFGFEVKDDFEGSIAGHRAGYPAAFEIIAAAFRADLFEGVDVDVDNWHRISAPFINLSTIHRLHHYYKSTNHRLSRDFSPLFLEVNLLTLTKIAILSLEGSYSFEVANNFRSKI